MVSTLERRVAAARGGKSFSAATDILMQTHPPPAIGDGRFPPLRPNDITLMFSGGVDSTALAIMLAERYERVHLVTYKNGYGHWYHHRTFERVSELNRALGDCFQYSLIDTKGYFDEILVKRVLEDYQKFRSGFIWFMGCKMAMHMRSAIYCLEHGLTHMTDGSNEDTNEMVEQMLISLTLIRNLYKHYQIDFGTPVYEVRREASRQLIKKWKLNMGIQVMDRHLCIQPTCVAGELYYMPYLLFHKKVQHDERQVARFIMEKMEIVRRIVHAYFDERGVDLDALLANRASQIAAHAAAGSGKGDDREAA